MTTALMLDQYNSVKASLSPLTTPDDTFRIPDIKRFALSETEMTAALQDKKLDQLVEDCSHHRRVNNTNDKDEKSKLNSNIKSRRRILIMRALKDKYARVIDDMENFMDVDDDEKKCLNEEKLLQKYGQHTQQNEAISDVSTQLSSRLLSSPSVIA
ncbi:hypothetical protein HMPREF1544_08059 [Mucor circinelloides 1006PhL]|uniref:Uncharacterized protein n=1 Tax=Mucor circinelloides f. circinelloides (strain 1006PhL) TaxID=1220926 RepID=S2JZ98_MUCC1|nr:hypothetical protein HMPREF1544_08059 [Mucor circinelloides 1006PhL]